MDVVEHQLAAPAQVSMTLPEFRRAVLANMTQANDAKTEGNTRFTAGDWQAAQEKYTAALELVGAALSVPTLSARPDMADLLKRAHATHAVCHLNLAAVAQKRGEFETAGDFCLEALRVEPRNVKAHFRLAKALHSQGKDEDALAAAEKAARFDAGRTPEVTALAIRLKKEVAARRQREQNRFGGLFGSERYAKSSAEERSQRDEIAHGHRLRVANTALARYMPADDDGVTSRALSLWLDGGADAVSKGDDETVALRAALMRLVRAAAADGALEDGELRDTLREHGLGPGLLAAGDPQAEGLSAEEAADAKQRAQVTRVKAIMAKVKDRQALSEEEQRVLDDFRAEEIARLTAQKAKGQPLSQEEEMLLAKLIAQRDQVTQQSAELRSRVAAAAEALRKLSSGEHVNIRERYNLIKSLEAEIQRLSVIDDTAGLTSEEAGSLRQLTAYMKQRERKATEREKQQDLLRRMQSDVRK